MSGQNTANGKVQMGYTLHTPPKTSETMLLRQDLKVINAILHINENGNLKCAQIARRSPRKGG